MATCQIFSFGLSFYSLSLSCTHIHTLSNKHAIFHSRSLHTSSLSYTHTLSLSQRHSPFLPIRPALMSTHAHIRIHAHTRTYTHTCTHAHVTLTLSLHLLLFNLAEPDKKRATMCPIYFFWPAAFQILLQSQLVVGHSISSCDSN